MIVGASPLDSKTCRILFKSERFNVAFGFCVVNGVRPSISGDGIVGIKNDVCFIADFSARWCSCFEHYRIEDAAFPFRRINIGWEETDLWVIRDFASGSVKRFKTPLDDTG